MNSSGSKSSSKNKNETLNLLNLDPHLDRLLNLSDLQPQPILLQQIAQAFTQSNLVLFCGSPGSGKTTQAAVYAQNRLQEDLTGQVTLIYTTFENCHNLTELLESFGKVYEAALWERGIEWQALEDFQRLRLIQDISKKVPFLWILDDFEVIEKHPLFAWSKSERKKARSFLQSVQAMTGQFLIIVNQERQSLPGDFPWNLPVQTVNNPLPTFFPRITEFSLQERQLIKLLSLFSEVLSSEVFLSMVLDLLPKYLPIETEFLPVNIQEFLEKLEDRRLLLPVAKDHFALLGAFYREFTPDLLEAFPVRKIARVFSQAMSNFGLKFLDSVQNGNAHSLSLLDLQQSNLVNGLLLAHRFGWNSLIIDLLDSLSPVMLHQRKYVAWIRLLDQVTSHFVHMTEGRRRVFDERIWRKFIQLRVSASLKCKRIIEAARWQQLLVDDLKQRVKEKFLEAKEAPNEFITDMIKAFMRLGQLFQLAGSPNAIPAYQEGFELSLTQPSSAESAEIAGLICECYLTIPVIQNIELAEKWAQLSLEKRAMDDYRGRSRSILLFGKLAYEKFLKSQKEVRSKDEQVAFLNEALEAYFEALSVLPDDAFQELGQVHELIGFLYLQADQGIPTAIEHYDQAIHYKEQVGDLLGACKARKNLAVALTMLGLLDYARDYANQALHGFSSLGSEAIEEVFKMRNLMEKLNQVTPLSQT